MKYEKPEIRAVSVATKAIAGMEKIPAQLVDSLTHISGSTVAAYEADE
jgi:hypothetical protein